MTTKTTTDQLSQSAIDNLLSIEEEIETSSQYLKPKPGKTYVVRINPLDKIEMVQTDRFKDAQGKPLKRYQFKLAHVNNGKERALGHLKNCLFRNHCRIEEGFYGVKGY